MKEGGSMQQSTSKHPRWQSFTSLKWYDGFIEFLFRFVAKTSEPLLALGLVFSAADVLTKGRLMQSNVMLTDLWAWTQAIAIESSGGVVLVYALLSFRDKDTVKGVLYVILASLLAIVGGMMLYSQLMSNATGAADAFAVGSSWQVQALVIMRVIVSVGYVVMCRTKHIRFNDLQETSVQATPALDIKEIVNELDARLQHRIEGVYQRIDFKIEQAIGISQELPAIRLLPPGEPVRGVHSQEDLESLGETVQGGQNGASYGDQIEAIYRAHPIMTTREIAKKVGCSPTTVSTWKKRFEVPGEGKQA